jgi:hypothetical protein
MVRRIAALLAATGLILMVAAPAWAVPLTNPLPIAWDDPEFQGDNCPDLDPGVVVWHFVINQSSTPTQSLTLMFENAGLVTVAGPDKVVDQYVLHFFVTTGEDTLQTAESSGDGVFVLSDICSGGPGEIIPEAPASVLLMVSAGLAGLGYLAWRRRSYATV